MNFILDIIASGLGWFLAFKLYGLWQERKHRIAYEKFEKEMEEAYLAANAKLDEEVREELAKGIGKVTKKAAKKKAVTK